MCHDTCPVPMLTSSKNSHDQSEFVSDHDLLRRFLQDSDEAAFQEIVHRHSGLVMGICRRVTGNSCDAEDAFQATFFALAKRPRSIRKCHSIAGWLYSVGWRTSVRLVKLKRKRTMEPISDQQPSTADDPLQQIAGRFENAVLDEELNLLPEQYRFVLVMTYFSSLSHTQIADQLGVSTGVVDGRITRARQMLRVRLARRGVALGALGVALATPDFACAQVAPELVESTINVGTNLLKNPTTAVSDPNISQLLRPEITLMTSTSSTLLCSCLVAGIAMVAVAASGPQSGSDGPVSASGAPTTSIDTVVAAPLSEVAETTPVSAEVSLTSRDSRTVPETQLTWASKPERTKVRYEGLSRSGERAREQQLLVELSQPIQHDFSQIAPSSLADAVTMISDLTGLQIVVDTVALNDEGLTPDIDIPNADFASGSPTLRSFLNRLLDPLDLTYEIRDEAIVVTTRSMSTDESYMKLHVYDISSLQLPGEAAEAFAESIMELVSPEQWAVMGGNATLKCTGKLLIVRHNQKGHVAIVDFLEQLENTAPEGVSNWPGSGDQTPAARGNTASGGFGGSVSAGGLGGGS